METDSKRRAHVELERFKALVRSLKTALREKHDRQNIYSLLQNCTMPLVLYGVNTVGSEQDKRRALFLMWRANRLRNGNGPELVGLVLHRGFCNGFQLQAPALSSPPRAVKGWKMLDGGVLRRDGGGHRFLRRCRGLDLPAAPLPVRDACNAYTKRAAAIEEARALPLDAKLAGLLRQENFPPGMVDMLPGEGYAEV